MDDNEPRLVKFKCPNCGHEWEAQIAPNLAVMPEQYCKECKRYSNCIKPYNFFTEMQEKLKNK